MKFRISGGYSGGVYSFSECAGRRTWTRESASRKLSVFLNVASGKTRRSYLLKPDRPCSNRLHEFVLLFVHAIMLRKSPCFNRVYSPFRIPSPPKQSLVISSNKSERNNTEHFGLEEISLEGECWLLN